MLEAVYGRLGEMRHRSETPEYRFAQHFERRGETTFTEAGKEVSAPLAGTIQVATVDAAS
jgi:hypothetical protein